MRIYPDGSGGYVLRGEDGWVIPLDSVTAGGIGMAIPVDAGGGGGDTYSMNPNVWYDNGTAMAGSEGDDPATLEPDTITLALIRIGDPDANLTGIGFVLYAPQDGDATARFALFAVSETGASRGLAGAKVADLGTVVVTDGAQPGDGFSLSPDAPVTPGLYWVGGSATATVSITGFRSYGGTVGRAAFTDGSSVSSAGISVASTGAHTAMPSTLVGVVEPTDLTQEAARFFFQVTPN
jgi:hypothetical protein